MKKSMGTAEKIVIANIFLLIGGALIRNTELPFQSLVLGLIFLAWIATVWLHLASTLKFSEVKS